MGIVYVPENMEYSLPQWYHRVRQKRLSELSLDDLCIACRQDVYLGSVMPLALRRLLSEPLAGYTYPGELLVAVMGIPKGYWVSHTPERNQVAFILDAAVKIMLEGDWENPDSELVAQIAKFKTLLGSVVAVPEHGDRPKQV